jgi:hypothetical protein
LHGGRDAKTFVDAAKIVVGEMQAERSPQIFPLARKTISQPGESADLHPHGEVLALDNGRADALRIRLAANWYYLR